MAGFGSIFGRISSLFTAGAVGGAAADSVAPVLRLVEQHANERRAVRVVDPGTAADAAAQQLDTDLHFRSLDESGGVVASSKWDGSPVDFENDAKRYGIGHERFRLLRGLRQRVPPYAEALILWRRERTDEATIDAVLAREGIPEGLWPALKELAGERLSPAQIALGIIRSMINDPGFMPVDLDTSGGVVPAYKVSEIDPVKEAKAHGIDAERLRVMVGEIGLPMSAQQAASALFRKIIRRPDYNRAILEGDTRPEWADAILEQARHILTAGEYVERQLRGFTDRAGRLSDTDKLGMSHEDSDKLYQVLGRSPSIHTVVIGLARGGKWPGSYANVPEPFRAEIQRSNIREEWAEVVYAARYNYPSPFVLRGLAEAGDLGDATAVEQLLLEIGWKPSLAASVSQKWQPSGTAADPHVGKANTQVWTALHKSYVGDEADVAKATEGFDLIGVPTIAQSDVLARWDFEKSLVRKQLSAAQIKRAYSKKVNNEATGSAWTRDDAVAALMDLGYSPADASTFLDL